MRLSNEVSHTLKIHYIQHVAFEGLGCIENWINEKQHSITCTKLYNNEALPNVNDFDWLIILGGPMGVNDSDKYDWLNHEKELIKQSVLLNKTVLGICLGAQLIASALGANVYKNTEKEIGWFPIYNINNNNVFDFLFGDHESFETFHWHGDTFDLPAQSTLIASSSACKNQAFVYQNKVVGLQFHLEVTKQNIQQMLTFGKNEIISGKYIQTIEAINKGFNFINENNKRMHALLNYLENQSYVGI
jgi:GMP synthase-like glutamine amidotransferase